MGFGLFLSLRLWAQELTLLDAFGALDCKVSGIRGDVGTKSEFSVWPLRFQGFEDSGLKIQGVG